ncbi:MAG: class I SAM-dependent methyltransferase [Acidobacteriota bacterium]|nr:class I SAM-dependent methyltransferase [Acidobacteriota bacterium]
MTWEPGLYDAVHSYVSDYGRSLVDLLAPKVGERILDLGCGTGTLTHEISSSGARVVGVDSSTEMIGQARQNYPKLNFRLGDARTFRDPEPFDAVFSNAVLHWVQPPADAISTVRAALRPGGRFVAEFGGKGNIAAVVGAAGVNPWYFPSIGEYATLLEQNGFGVSSALLFDRPTRLEGERGLREWVAMFYKPQLPEDLVERMEIELRPKLFQDGSWMIDYKRLRIAAGLL